MIAQVERPLVALAMGDVSGIGPEILVKVLTRPPTYELCRPLIVGDPLVIAENCHIIGADVPIHAIEETAEAHFAAPEIDVLSVEGDRTESIPWGRPSAATGNVAARCLARCFDLVAAGHADGVVSAPMSKEALHLAGYGYPDELAFLAELTSSRDTFTVGVMDSVWTLALAEHVPFSAILQMVTKARVRWCIEKLNTVLHTVGFATPRIGVAALNVHAGENGLFGREEIDEIEPAVAEARLLGLHVTGPIPADTVFVRALAGEFDGVVSMYHDQANIARKLQPMNLGATFFMGLPVPCGTTAHGTACDIAGKGIADPGSLEAALKHTSRLASA